MDDRLLKEVAHRLQKETGCEVRLDAASRVLYSTDASIYQVEPLGVVFPRTGDDLSAIVSIASQYGVPILPRGSGSSLAGQAVGAALVIDCSRHLNHILSIDPETNTAVVEPGVVLNAFNRAAAKFGLQYGPDPASSDRATFGGMLGNNSTGAHSILYGMTADHLLSTDVVLSDGSLASLGNTSLDQAEQIASGDGLEGVLYRIALYLRREYAQEIRARWPRTWRRASGYSLNYLLPWSATAPPRWEEASHISVYPPHQPGEINLGQLLVGSEGTLAIFRQATVNLVPLPQHTVLGALAFDSVVAASEATPAILELGPSAVELLPRALIQLARAVPAYARHLSFVQGDPAALLLVEFAGDSPDHLLERVKRLGPNVVIAGTPEEQDQIWAVRKVGLGLLMSRPGDTKPLPFIEDVAVPVDKLGEFVAGVERIMASFGTTGNFYAHASAGCLHIRPLVNLKTPGGVAAMRGITAEVVKLTLRLGGALSGEHGDGLARAEWLEEAFGPRLVDAFRQLKGAADPQGILNPGKVVDPPSMDENLRYGPAYAARAWQPVFDFSSQGDLIGAIEMCNGAGVCRKENGVMCPSFQATSEEMHSTRGRANLLRAMIAGHSPTESSTASMVYQALDLCLECKGCKAECPSAVDMAKLKYEFLDHYYESHRRPLRDYLFAHLGTLASFGRPFAPLVNPLLRSALVRHLGERLLGIAHQRQLPELQRPAPRLRMAHSATDPQAETVIFLSDPFTRYFHPRVEARALGLLAATGCQVHMLPVLGSGRTLISKGFLESAKRHAARVLDAITELDLEGKFPIVGVEPSEIFTLRDEYLDFFPQDECAARVARRSYMIDEFLLRAGTGPEPRLAKLVESMGEIGQGKTVHLHGHCYQKAQPPSADGFPVGVAATEALLRAFGYRVQTIETGCCGMAGSFGYEVEHYQLSMQVGELALFPAVRAAPQDHLVVAAGVSCQAQIQSGTHRLAHHPVTLLRDE